VVADEVAAVGVVVVAEPCGPAAVAAALHQCRDHPADRHPVDRHPAGLVVDPRREAVVPEVVDRALATFRHPGVVPAQGISRIDQAARDLAQALGPARARVQARDPREVGAHRVEICRIFSTCPQREAEWLEEPGLQLGLPIQVPPP
jgi:hypothetical protein